MALRCRRATDPCRDFCLGLRSFGRDGSSKCHSCCSWLSVKTSPTGTSALPCVTYVARNSRASLKCGGYVGSTMPNWLDGAWHVVRQRGGALVKEVVLQLVVAAIDGPLVSNAVYNLCIAHIIHMRAVLALCRGILSRIDQSSAGFSTGPINTNLDTLHEICTRSSLRRSR